MNHKEMTAHIRGRIKADKIAARVSLYTSCGTQWIRVLPVRHDLSFSGEEARKISVCAKVNGLTLAMQMPINDSFQRWDGSGATNFHFEFHR